jgi:hypothetical protein
VLHLGEWSEFGDARKQLAMDDLVGYGINL